MKSTLMLKKFDTKTVPGTMNLKDLRTFFGGKLIYTEDLININDDSIQFSYVLSGKNTGFQYYDDNIPDDWETSFVENLTDLKKNNQTLTLLNQNADNLINNTRWQVIIKAKNILTDYLFFKMKESRIFKMINYTDLYNLSINKSIYDYIKNNIINTYKFENIEFYAEYYDIKVDQAITKNVLLQFNPSLDVDTYKPENYIKDINIINLNIYDFENITIQYNQSKPSSQFGFNYYFNLTFSKV